MCITPDRRVEPAVQAIIDLINSRSTSPRRDEIAAIIARVAVAPVSSANDCSAQFNHKGLDEYGPDISGT
jgi:hypothetical protein